MAGTPGQNGLVTKEEIWELIDNLESTDAQKARLALLNKRKMQMKNKIAFSAADAVDTMIDIMHNGDNDNVRLKAASKLVDTAIELEKQPKEEKVVTLTEEEYEAVDKDEARKAIARRYKREQGKAETN